MLDCLTDWLADRCIEWHAEHAPGFHGDGKRCGYLTGCGYWRKRWWVPGWLWRRIS